MPHLKTVNMLFPTCKALHNKGFLEGWPFLCYWREEGLRDVTFSHDVHLCDQTKGETITVLSWGEKQVLHIFTKYKPLYTLWMGRASLKAGWGDRVARDMLFLSYLLRMAVFPSDILEPLEWHVSTHGCLDDIKGTALSERKRSYAHLLTCCYCCCFFFFLKKKSFVT